jgi:hypothetical protein
MNPESLMGRSQNSFLYVILQECAYGVHPGKKIQVGVRSARISHVLGLQSW